MTRWVFAVIAGSAALGGAALVAPGNTRYLPAPPVMPEDLGAEKIKRQVACRQQRNAADQARYAAARRDQVALVARLDGADPERDAQAAAASGDFRLIYVSTMMDTRAMAVTCRVPQDNRFGGLPLTLATRFYSDVPGSCETRGGADPCRTEKLLDAYAPAYNRTLITDPRYPYGDLCRVGAAAIAVRDTSPDPADYGFPGLAATDRPHDLYEAARRGTPAAVARMIAAADRDRIDRPDPYGMTPLAWAVQRRRADIAARLLAAGANPIGAECDAPDRAESPLRLALWTGQGALAKRMLTPAVMDRVTPWPGGLLEAAAHGGVADLLNRMLHEPHQGINGARLAGIDGLPAATQTVIDTFQRSLCWHAKLPRGTGIQMVGVYESGGVKRGFGEHRMGPVRVRVSARAGPVLLVLSAYEPVEWRIEVSPGARLAGVIALGYERPVVTGVARNIPVVVNELDESCPGLPHKYPYQPGADQRELADAVAAATGATVREFQGNYGGREFTLR